MVEFIPKIKPLRLNEERELNFTPNSFQINIWNCLFDERGDLRKDICIELAAFGGYGNGKSSIFMVIVYYLCIKFSGLKWLFCRQFFPQLRDSVILQFEEIFPPQISNYKLVKHPVPDAIFSNGSRIFFRAFDGKGIAKILSTSYDGATICQAEQTSKNLILEIIGRLRSNRLPSQLFMMEGNPDGASWCMKRYKSGELPHKCKYFEASTDVNKDNLPPDYIDRMRREFSDLFVKQKIEGNWDITIGKVHPEFDKNFNIINPFTIKDYWYKSIGMDHGYVNPTAMLWGAVDENKIVYIYDEFYMSHQRTSQLVEANKKYGPMPTPGDTSMKSIKNMETGTGTLWDDLKREGVNLIEVPKHKNANIQLINKLIHQRRLFIFRRCVNLIEELEGYIWKPQKIGDTGNAKEEVRKENDHACDALQYLIRYLHDIKVLTPEEKNYSNTLAYHTKETYNEEDEY